MKTLFTKREIVVSFAKSIPNVERVSYGTEKVTVWFDNVHSREYTWEYIEEWAQNYYRGYTELVIV